ncbi:aminopeptidase [Lacicoccus alkaliphilus]|uniref:Aminopeptidase n=1 Tax=Lacicoccus alkaliphilus DSM 16010 TaxID=1123231 RepID=A0A1M7K9Z9_9BACL|nr:aminopeptidase [Salinicoccus alkaliphilus]SHM62054.1 aminopeptidase [Salinicoccus alkaliphilus DSM 16010]
MSKLEKYASLLVEVGLNVQKGQRVSINASADALPLVRLVTEKAYGKGAKDVNINLKDDRLTQLHAHNKDVLEYAEVPQWVIDQRMFYSDEKAAFLSITSSSPELLKGVDQEKLKSMQIAYGNAFKEYSNRIQSDYHSWCVAGYPSVEWAKLVFPDKAEDAAVDALLELIFYTMRINHEDPVEAWLELDASLHEKVDILNEKHFHALRYEGPGTDFTMELPEKHLWAGASSVNSEGVRFMANMPTEEVFTAPKKDGVNGCVSNTKPLSYGGNIIDGFKLTFKDGKVVDYEAEQGYDVLKNLLETDDGAQYLGEVALVPDDSPISNTGTLFFNTLFDENASCHIALGSAYGFSIDGGKDMSRGELTEAGLNDSITHVDFMIGSADLNIYGVDSEGAEIPIFIKGNWAI